MDEATELLVPALIVVTLAVLVFGSKLWRRKRAEAIAEWAHQNGWHYERWRPDLAETFHGYPFGRGRKRRAQHVLTRTHRGHEVLAFEYTYTMSGARHHSTTTFHEIIAVRIPTPQPMLEVTREHFGHKILALVGVHDLQLPNERFNSTFRVHTANDQFAYEVLDHSVMEWLLADERSGDVSIRFTGNYLLTWRRGTMDTATIPSDIDFTIDFLEHVPAPVWHSNG